MASELAPVLPLEELGMQVCRGPCGRTLPFAEFNKLHTMRLGISSRCKKCASAAARAWTEKNADKSLDGHLRRRFGITLERYNAMLADQGGVCAICGEPPTAPRNRRKGMQRTFAARLVVDHDHTTGQVRGLLCSSCNTGIGNLKDEAATVRAALRYLEERHGVHGDALPRKASGKLSEADVEWIRSGYGGLSQKQAAEKLGVHPSVISRISTGDRGR